MVRSISKNELKGKIAYKADGKPLHEAAAPLADINIKPKTISRKELEQFADTGKAIFNESGIAYNSSLGAITEGGVEQSVSDTSSLADNAPPSNNIINVEPAIINVPPAEVSIRPEIIVQPQAVTVAAPDMQPIADAIFEMREAITESARQQVFVPPAHVSIDPQSPPDMTPIANAMIEIAKVEQSRPDHSSQILELLKQMADRQAAVQWTFKVLRDSRGDIEEITAIKTVTGGSE